MENYQETATQPGRKIVDENDKHVGYRVRERRIELGLSQHELADRINQRQSDTHVRLNLNHIHKHEKGLWRIYPSRLVAIADALDVEPAYFFKGLGKIKKFRHTPKRRRMAILAEDYIGIPTKEYQSAINVVARALSGKAD